MAKTEFLQIRLTPDDRQRLQNEAMTDHLDLSTWARRLLLQHMDKLDSKGGGTKSSSAKRGKGKRR